MGDADKELQAVMEVYSSFLRKRKLTLPKHRPHLVRLMGLVRTAPQAKPNTSNLNPCDSMWKGREGIGGSFEFCNDRRPHSALGYQPPGTSYETMLQEAAETGSGKALTLTVTGATGFVGSHVPPQAPIERQIHSSKATTENLPHDPNGCSRKKYLVRRYQGYGSARRHLSGALRYEAVHGAHR